MAEPIKPVEEYSDEYFKERSKPTWTERQDEYSRELDGYLQQNLPTDESKRI
jgi:hypothetical protein